jgi:hypothetical protein
MSANKIRVSRLCVVAWLALPSAPLPALADALYYVSTTGADVSFCGQPGGPCKTIGYVLGKAQTNNTTTINLAAGTYNETLAFDRKNIVINGAGNATTFIVGNNTNATINVFSARLDVSNLTIKNGNPGIVGTFANIQCNNVVLQNNTQGASANFNSFLGFQGGGAKSNGFGINVWQNSSANIANATFSQNGQGVNVDMSSSANIIGSTISQNTGAGVNLSGSSSASIMNSALSSNQGLGLFVGFGSSASLQGSTVSGNSQGGINVFSHASLRLSGGNKVTANGSAQVPAIMVGQHSQALIQRNPTSTVDSISLNAGRGISVSESSTLFMIDGIVDSNNSNGVDLGSDSIGNFSSNTVITNNKGWGVVCDYSSHYNGSLGTVSGNTSPWQVACLHF